MLFRKSLYLLAASFSIVTTSAALGADSTIYIFPLKSGIWSSTNINTCWENPSPQNEGDRLAVQQAVSATWESNSAVRFQGWASCNISSNGIRILINDEGPHVKALGKHLDGMRNGMVLNFTYENWSPTCKQRRKFCNEVIAVHEFGHALGFAHEQNRPDSPEWCREQRQGGDGDMFITPFDLNSVMNYCNPSWSGNGVLSAIDISGLRQLYGAPRNTSDFRFVLQVPTGLHETDDDFDFSFMANGDLMAVKKAGTGSGKTEVHILSAASNYSKFRLQTATALHQTDNNFAFTTLPNGDLMAIKKSGTGSGKTEVHILSAASNYSKFRLQTATALHQTDNNFAFTTLPNGDLMAIKKSGTGSGTTEVHVLSAESNYSKFRLQTGTALHETDSTFSFAALNNGDLMAIKKARTGTGSTEVHILNAASGYSRFSLQTGTGLHETDNTFSFASRNGNELIAIKKSGTGSGSTEIHILMKSQ